MTAVAATSPSPNFTQNRASTMASWSTVGAMLKRRK